MTQTEMMKKIQELSFVKCELELFLDTHPESAVALENYKDCIAALDSLKMQYSEKFAPITASGTRGDSWSWTAEPWPWQNEFPNNQNGMIMPRNSENREVKG